MTGIRCRVAIVVCVLLHLAHPPRAAAEDAGRVSIAGGLEWAGGASFGSADATEVTASGGSYRLFSTSSDLTAGAGVGVKVGVRLTRLFEVEAEGAYLRPSIETSVSNDVEGGGALTAAERLRQFTIEGGVLYALSRWRTARVRPFLAVSAGYLRQLHENDGLAATGGIFEFGGGARLPFVSREGERLKSFGVRLDARAAVRTKAAAFDGRAHVSPAVGVSAFATF